ncbi:uncharacterized protein CBL_04236 [Carabus blaptoides fortunei]
MPVVILEKVDNDNFTPSFNVGEHTIGRGSNLLCNSKKISRNHGKLKITESDGVFLESIHNNPCFYQKCNSPNISIVTFGNTIQIHNDDQIALSLDDGWFKVHIKVTVNTTNKGDVQSTSSGVENVIAIDTNKDNLSRKRELDESNETDSKRLKNFEASELSRSDAANATTVEKEQTINASTSENTGHNIISASEIKKEPLETNLDNDNRCHISNNSDAVIKTEPVEDEIQNSNPAGSKIDNNTDTTIKEEPPGANDVPIGTEIDNNIDTALDDSLQINNDNTSTKDDTEKVVKEEKKDSTDDTCKNKDNDGKASTSGTNKRVWRDRCWYGSTCYRKNAAHRIELTHPGDSDYDSDPNDTRPICCYGTDCYRKNKEHRKRLKHPGQKKLGTKPPSQRKKRKVKKRNPSPANSDFEDSYDGSFIDDGSSSDEYEPTGESDTESDYEDEDDSQRDDRNLMLHEARKFTHGAISVYNQYIIINIK